LGNYYQNPQFHEVTGTKIGEKDDKIGVKWHGNIQALITKNRKNQKISSRISQVIFQSWQLPFNFVFFLLIRHSGRNYPPTTTRQTKSKS
jgi:hypothetical protein